jgi:hypothetical protein
VPHEGGQRVPQRLLHDVQPSTRLCACVHACVSACVDRLVLMPRTQIHLPHLARFTPPPPTQYTSPQTVQPDPWSAPLQFPHTRAQHAPSPRHQPGPIPHHSFHPPPFSPSMGVGFWRRSSSVCHSPVTSLTRSSISSSRSSLVRSGLQWCACG